MAQITGLPNQHNRSPSSLGPPPAALDQTPARETQAARQRARWLVCDCLALAVLAVLCGYSITQTSPPNCVAWLCAPPIKNSSCPEDCHADGTPPIISSASPKAPVCCLQGVLHTVSPLYLSLAVTTGLTAVCLTASVVKDLYSRLFKAPTQETQRNLLP